LTIGQPGDRYEQEADHVASQVMNMSQPAQGSVQKQDKEEEEIQTKSLIQRQEMPEEEEIQTKPLIQRQEMPEEEEIQTKPLAHSITPLIQRQETPEEDEMQMKPEIQREAMPEEDEMQMKPMVQRSGGIDSDGLEQNLSNSKGGGSPLPNETRAFMEPRFGADFSQVRIHNDSTANQMNQSIQAQAFTHGKDIYFNSGKYSPDSSEGKTLLAHELTHVVQQTGDR
jgi:hypothetical protein